MPNGDTPNQTPSPAVPPDVAADGSALEGDKPATPPDKSAPWGWTGTLSAPNISRRRRRDRPDESYVQTCFVIADDDPDSGGIRALAGIVTVVGPLSHPDVRQQERGL